MTTKAGYSAKDITYIGVFAALLAVCSWISVPTPVPFTLQTFAVMLAVGILGGHRGTITVLVYILLAAVGAPVLAGFTGGVGVLLGSTGGYILGFLLTALIMWGIERVWGNGRMQLAFGMAAGMTVCYIFGTVWFVAVYTRTGGEISFWGAFMTCVLPYLIPDAVKAALALEISMRLRRYVR